MKTREQMDAKKLKLAYSELTKLVYIVDAKGNKTDVTAEFMAIAKLKGTQRALTSKEECEKYGHNLAGSNTDFMKTCLRCGYTTD